MICLGIRTGLCLVSYDHTTPYDLDRDDVFPSFISAVADRGFPIFNHDCRSPLLVSDSRCLTISCDNIIQPGITKFKHLLTSFSLVQHI
jgi:hypothetical protein